MTIRRHVHFKLSPTPLESCVGGNILANQQLSGKRVQAIKESVLFEVNCKLSLHPIYINHHILLTHNLWHGVFLCFPVLGLLRHTPRPTSRTLVPPGYYYPLNINYVNWIRTSVNWSLLKFTKSGLTLTKSVGRDHVKQISMFQNTLETYLHGTLQRQAQL